MTKIGIIGLGFLLMLSCHNQGTGISNELKNQTEDILKTVLKDGQNWEKVHAGEFLIGLGSVDIVFNSFLSEFDKYGGIPEYRIGIWRVLYKCAGKEEKQVWQDSIYRAFLLPTSPDRIHAAETLAKLKISIEKIDSEIMEAAMTSTDSRLKFYTQWWVIPQLENGAEKIKNHLFHIIQSDATESLRQMAAYVLCEDKDIHLNISEWQLLKDIAIHEPVNSVARLQLLAAALSKATDDSVQTDSFQDIKKMMLGYTNSNKSALYQLCLSLARKGDMKDIDELKVLLHHQENDVKIAAAYAILQINNQTKYF